ncbi:hypothetical protein [Peptoanaerobacter stomatis]
MKKLLKLLIILILISSLLSAISFFAFDFANVRAIYNHNSIFHSHKYNPFRDYIEDEIDDVFDDNYEDYGIINKGANLFAKSQNILDGVSDFVSDTVIDEMALGDYFENEMSKEYKYLLKTENLNKFDELYINLPSSSLCVQIEKSDKYKIDFYSKRKSNDNVKLMKINQNGSKYEITSPEKFDKNTPYLVISTPDAQNLKVKFDTDSAVFVAKESLKSADLKTDNAVISLSGEKSYNINIDASDSIARIDLKNYDAQINVKSDSGIVNILGKKYMLEDKTISEKIKNGKDKINIEMDSGFIKIK